VTTATDSRRLPPQDEEVCLGTVWMWAELNGWENWMDDYEGEPDDDPHYCDAIDECEAEAIRHLESVGIEVDYDSDPHRFIIHDDPR
jgi:hypothetical protein